ncbi:MAG: serine/threonine protein kinase [Labilithrix sp.]|nr:serine/threonine protein kinase [Labilithrix sp.]
MASPSLPPGGLVEGTTLAGKYRIDRMLGAGGMCLVYEAEHVHLRQAVALKVLKPELARDPTAVARFAQEAQAAAKLRSPNVARVHDVDRLPDGQPYITMELLVGHDLGTELQRRYALPVDLAVDYVRQAANGISEAHALGIVHRDLKPENLFLTELGEMTERRLLKILDFGIAKNVHEGARKLTAPDAVFGTVDYMSPEQIRSASSVDHRTDIWALGVILFELLTGRTPYSGDARSVIAQIVSDPVVPPSRLVPTLPPGLVAVIMKALAKDPAARFQSAEELRRALAPFADGVEPIANVLARLPPATVPRRNHDASRPSMDGLRDARTNLSFETTSPRKAWAKRAFALPLFAALGALLGLAVWKRDVILRRPQPRVEVARATPPAVSHEPPVVATAPPVPATPPTALFPSVLGASAPPEPAGASAANAAPPPATPTAAKGATVKAKPKAPPPPRPSAAPPAPPPPAPTPTTSSTPALPKHL